MIPDDSGDDDDDKETFTVDEREHAQAELGHLLEAGSDDEDDDVEDYDEDEADKNDDGDEEEEVEEGDEHEADDVIDEGEEEVDDGDESKKAIDFGDFGGASDDNGTDDDDDASDDDDDDLDEEGGDLEAEDSSMKTFSSSGGGNNKLEKDRKKGREIKRQQEIWDSLLEVRIQLQKILTKVNQFPQPEAYDQLQNQNDDEEEEEEGKAPSAVDFKKCVKRSQSSIAGALDELLSVRKSLINSNVDTKVEEEDEDEPLPKKMKLKEYSGKMEADFEGMLAFRNNTIEKWNDKTRLASGGGNVNQKSFAAFELSALKQIEHILSDKSRLVKRTQLKRTDYQILGKGDSEESAAGNSNEEEDNNYDEEVFDDDDFYHQLLRDLIEKKSEGGSDGGSNLGQKWLQIQKLRSKSKRKVDTRASKGRRIRYDIHSKLVNFMAPILHAHGGDGHHQISEEARNELFNSLFK